MSTARQAYRASETRHLRDELIVSNLRLVKVTLGRMLGTLPAHVDREQLESAGVVGLVRAVDKYEPAKGEFAPYAKVVIRGAIIDELRRSSGVSQHMLQRIKQVEQARQALEPPATVERIAEHASLSEEQVSEALDAARCTRVEAGLPLEEIVATSDKSRSLIPGPDGDPVDVAAHGELRDALASAITRLEDRDRLIVTMYHLEGMTLGEIGEVIGLHPGNVGRRLSDAMHTLREDLRSHVPHET